MGEHPILFSGPLVRAIIEGRKTQTRRVARLTDAGHVKEPRGHRRWHPADTEAYRASPYGLRGDSLWVRETWDVAGFGWCEPPREYHADVAYRADGAILQIGVAEGVYRKLEAEPDTDVDRWRPSIHMPRWASRLTLRVTGVRVERLQDISEEDARAEGVLDVPNPPWPETARHRFSVLWDSINGKRPGCSWADNPWCWVVSFQRTTTEET